MSKSKYQKIDLSGVDRKKIKQDHGIETLEKIKISDEIKHTKDLWTYPKNVTGVRCFWDHHQFEGQAIFCPISYKPKQVAKIDNNYTIKENIHNMKEIRDKNIIPVTDAYYEVDGVFCSPECCLAYINSEKTKAGGSKFFESERLLHLMIKTTTKITPANDFRLLKEYGGNLTIEQFRNNNTTIKYDYCGTTVLISHLFEKKINLSTL